MSSAGARYQAHETAIVEAGADIGAGTRIWHFSHIMPGAVIGAECNLAQNVFVADEVRIGRGCKIQNNVSVYSGCVLEDFVFLGPSCVLTNTSNPRAEMPRRALYERTLIRRGATVGANATVVCGVTIGRYAFVAAGAVVTKDVPDYGFVLGAPSRQDGWMSRHGHRLSLAEGETTTCPESGWKYTLSGGVVTCADCGEDDALVMVPGVGTRPYRDFKQDSERAES